MKNIPQLSQRALAAIAAAVPAPADPIPEPTHTKLDDPIPALITTSPIRIALQQMLSGLVSPLAAAVAPGDPGHLYVCDQVGQIWRMSTGLDHHHHHHPAHATLFLDVQTLLVPLGVPPLNYDERGLLGLAFHPDFQTNARFYTFTSQPADRPADFSTMPAGVAPNCQSVITEWRVRHPGDPDSPVDLASARELLRLDKPQLNHNGGAMAFGPDKMLYVSLGDGGNADDQGVGHVPGGNGQSLAPGNILGKILRIDPLGHNSANGKYGIPPDNPFVGKDGADEIFAYGFRNPFRMSFDRTGQLWVGDVGQNDIEEVDVVTAGGNYGWRIKEGTFLFDPNGDGPGFVYENSPGSPGDLFDPVAEYDHADGPGLPETRVAVIGGFVYRGQAIRALRGHYVFGDYSAEIGEAAAGHLFTLGATNQVQELVAVNRDPLDLAVLGFGQDAQGELYLLANGTGVLRGNTGVVLKIVAPGHPHC